MIDIELLDPTFCGLNFSITGNMRAGIFVKEILEKEASQGCLKLNSSDQLQTGLPLPMIVRDSHRSSLVGDRIMALTICFQSIVYEDALTILSYASPYPVCVVWEYSARVEDFDYALGNSSCSTSFSFDESDHGERETFDSHQSQR